MCRWEQVVRQRRYFRMSWGWSCSSCVLKYSSFMWLILKEPWQLSFYPIACQLLLQKTLCNNLVSLQCLLKEFSPPWLPSVQIQRFLFNLEGFACLKDCLIFFSHLLVDLIKNNSFPCKVCLSYSLKPSQLQQCYYCEQSCLHFNESNCAELKGN